MQTSKIIFVALLALLVTGCARDNNNKFKPLVSDKNAVDIELLNSKSDYKLAPIDVSEFTDSVRLVVLEETDKSTISMLYQVLLTQEYIVAVDRMQKCLIFFDWNGKYLKSFSRVGQGPEEYISITRCLLDEQKQQLIIYDFYTRKILFYDLSGNFIRAISNFSEGAVVRDVINLSNGNFLCYTPDSDLKGKVDEKYIGLWEVDADGKFLRSHFKYNVVLPGMFSYMSYFQPLSNGAVSLRDETHSDIYHYRSGAVEKYISYDIKNSDVAKSLGHPNNPPDDKWDIRTYTAQEKDNYIITLWHDGNSKPMYSIFSKKSGALRYWDAFNLNATAPHFLDLPVDSNRPDMFVFQIDRNAIDKHLSDRNIPEPTRKTLKHLAQRVGNSENPILELLYIKK